MQLRFPKLSLAFFPLLAFGGGTNLLNVPIGVDLINNGNGHAGLQFTGVGVKGKIADNTGLLAVTYGSLLGNPSQGDTSIELNVAGQQLMRWEGVAATEPDVVIDVTLRPDCVTLYGPCNLGNGPLSHAIRPFGTLFNRNTVFGGDPNSLSFSTSNSMSRALWFTHGGWSNGGYGTNGLQSGLSVGMGFDALNGTEWYLSLWDGATAYKEALNVTLSTVTTTLSAPANTAADSTPAQTLVLKGANKTAGTGVGGDLILSGSTSAGGANGNIYIPSISGAPISPASHSGFVPLWYDSSSSKLCIKDGSSVKCTLMN